MALWVVVVRLECQAESVAWRQDGLIAWMMPIGRVLMPTKLSQDLCVIEYLKGKKDGFIAVKRV